MSTPLMTISLRSPFLSSAYSILTMFAAPLATQPFRCLTNVPLTASSGALNHSSPFSHRTLVKEFVSLFNPLNILSCQSFFVPGATPSVLSLSVYYWVWDRVYLRRIGLHIVSFFSSHAILEFSLISFFRARSSPFKSTL